MGILNKLFGKSGSKSSSSGGRISMAAMTLQQNHKVTPQSCGVDGRTFPCPTITHTVITADINRFGLDVGGYCSSCRDFRCQNHCEFKEMEKMAFGIFCSICGNRVTGINA